MPVVNYQGTTLTEEQKTELIRSFTRTVSEITGAPAEFTSVVIQEYSHDSLGVGGKTVAEIIGEHKK